MMRSPVYLNKADETDEIDFTEIYQILDSDSSKEEEYSDGLGLQNSNDTNILNQSEPIKKTIKFNGFTYSFDTDRYVNPKAVKAEYDEVITPLFKSAENQSKTREEKSTLAGLAKKLGIPCSTMIQQFTLNAMSVRVKNALYHYFSAHLEELDEIGKALLPRFAKIKDTSHPSRKKRTFKKIIDNANNNEFTYSLDTSLYMNSEALEAEYRDVLIPLFNSAKDQWKANGKQFSRPKLIAKMGLASSTFSQSFNTYAPSVDFKDRIYNYFNKNLQELTEEGKQLLPKLAEIKDIPRKKKKIEKETNKITYSLDTNLYINAKEIEAGYNQVIIPIVESADQSKANGEEFSRNKPGAKMDLSASTFTQLFTTYAVSVNAKNTIYDYFSNRLQDLTEEGKQLLLELAAIKDIPPKRKNIPPKRKNIPPKRKNIPPKRKNIPPKRKKIEKETNKITYSLDTNLYINSKEIEDEYKRVIIPILKSAQEQSKAKGKEISRRQLSAKMGLASSTFTGAFTTYAPSKNFKNTIYDYFSNHLEELTKEGQDLLPQLDKIKDIPPKKKKTTSQTPIVDQALQLTTMTPNSEQFGEDGVEMQMPLDNEDGMDLEWWLERISNTSDLFDSNETLDTIFVDSLFETADPAIEPIVSPPPGTTETSQIERKENNLPGKRGREESIELEYVSSRFFYHPDSDDDSERPAKRPALTKNPTN